MESDEWPPFSSNQESKEQWQAWLDYFKHMSTISLAISVLVMAIYKDHNPATSKDILFIAIGFFMSSTFCGIVFHSTLIATYRRGLGNKIERFFGGWAFILHGFLFTSGMVALVIYVVKST